MTKDQLISLLYYKNGNYPKKVIAKIVDVIFSEISKGVAEGKEVRVRGFGTFAKRSRGAKVIRHPKMKRLIKIEPYSTMHYSYSSNSL